MTVKRKRAPDVRSTCAASVPLKRVFSGTSTPPAAYSPSAATIHWCMFGAHTDARSPGCSPVATNALRRLAHRGVELGERQPGVAIDDRFVVGPEAGGPVHDARAPSRAGVRCGCSRGGIYNPRA